MKLALVRQRYTPFGGAERFVDRALGALKGAGLDVTVITRRWKGGESPLAVRICNPFHLGRWWRDASFARQVQAIIRSGEFDLVQSHERIPGCHVYRAGDGVHATWLDLRARVQSPLAHALTRWHPWQRYVLRAEAALFRHPDLRAVICNSRMVRDDLIERFGVPEEKLHVIHNGVDLEYFHPGLRHEHRVPMRQRLGIPEQAPVVLFVGAGFERKGVFPLLKAMTCLPADAHLVVVGKDRRLPRAEAEARRLGLADRCHFVGGQSDVRPWYGLADVFALPTLYDPFPNAVLEALACGLPVLTSPTSGGAELIQPDFGAVVDALDWQGQGKALAGLLGASTQPDTARNAAARCSRADMTERLVGLYRRLMAGSS